MFTGTTGGLNIGVVAALGNKFQRLGLTCQAYYYDDWAQVNAEVRLYHNFKNLGPAGQYNELVASAGAVLGYGVQQKEHNPFLTAVSNQTGYTNSFGYSLNAYFNKIGTTQQTGTIALQFNKISIITDNDIFARPLLDRFRTGAFLLQYQYKELYQFAVNCTMWTGQMGWQVDNDDEFPFGCYKDTTGGVYAHCSHGLLSGQFKMALNNGQNLQANIGTDAEQVRNFVQNRLIHDLIFIPKNWIKRVNCHVPMLDTACNQYLYRPGQKVKRPQPYWNVFTGAASFY
jgi:putative RNase toxin 23 of polymorphic toxin system